jgi:hypothetical protein
MWHAVTLQAEAYPNDPLEGSLSAIKKGTQRDIQWCIRYSCWHQGWWSLYSDSPTTRFVTYGVKFVTSHDGVSCIPYAVQAGLERCLCKYKSRDVVNMVGPNNTCNDGLPTWDVSCWKKQDFLPKEWPCFQNHMDSHCPAMLEGPNQCTQGLHFKKYRELYYGQPTHVLHVIPGVGHNATAMFGSPVASLQELFDLIYITNSS